jgi:hypothetical protein
VFGISSERGERERMKMKEEKLSRQLNLEKYKKSSKDMK